jgi:hypothetical protein
MKHHDSQRHPGPFRLMGVGAESVGILVAVTLLVLGLVGLPLAKWFLLGALIVGSGVALLLRLSQRE